MAQNEEVGPIKLAFIIDNRIVDLLHTDERYAAIFQSNPVVVDVTAKSEDPNQYIMPGGIYNPELGTFSYPEGE